ncbi:unnamed protein product [Ectocarpus sp. CCAP 1310/34]|nr:unnamed protein product [Ectocarpus sp. CCAP 1310/34]
MVYKLERSLYGLSQSPALRNDTLDESLTVFGWKTTQSDPCMYVYTSGNIIVILTLVDQKKKELTDRFEMTDMGEVKRILGIDVERDYEQGTLAILQEHCVNTFLERAGLRARNPGHFTGALREHISGTVRNARGQPSEHSWIRSGIFHESTSGPILGPTDKKIYQSMTGSILYLAQCTRSDLSYAALQLSKTCSDPAQVNMTAAKHVLRYLRGNQFRLAAFTDASFGANPDYGRSTTGYLFFLAGGLISYGPILGPTDKKIYQSMTGSILYLAQCTRSDLSYAALQLSKTCSDPAQVNMTAAKHVLRYLRGNQVLPIV